MSTPSVDVTELDGALGVLPPEAGLPLVVAGPSTLGPYETPVAFGRESDVIASFGLGEAVEEAVYWIKNYQRPVIFIRTHASTAGSAGTPVSPSDGTCSAVTKHGTGACVASIHTGATPATAMSVIVKFPIGGTVGVAGIIYQVSLDGGATWSFATALGTDTDIVLPGAGGVQVDLTSASIVANDYYTFTTTAPVLASAGTLAYTGSWNQAPTIDAGSAPVDNYEGLIVFLTGSLLGVAGATYQYSLDGGRTGIGTGKPTYALGTATSITLGDSGMIIALHGVNVPGDATISFRTTAPQPSAAELQTAIEALKTSAYEWRILYPACIVDSSIFDALGTEFASLAGMNKRKAWVGGTRIRALTGETRPQYQTAIGNLFASKTTLVGSLYAGDAKIYSGVSGRRYRRSAAFAAAAREAWLDDHQNAAQIDWGPLPGVQLGDDNGNPDCHDEYMFPGLDDLRFATLRTWARRAGAFVTDPRIFCPNGSDFVIMPYRRVMSVFEEISVDYLETRLQKPVRVNATTGFILEADAKEIESGWRAAVDAVLSTGPKISARSCRVSRTDNLLSTRTMTCDGSLVPLTYPRRITLRTSFVNPARNVVPV